MRILLAILLLCSTTAFTFHEQSIKCRSLTIMRDEDGKPFALAHCESFAEDGSSLRRFEVDVLPLMTAQQRNALHNAVDGMLGLVRIQRSVPSPSPTRTPAPTSTP